MKKFINVLLVACAAFISSQLMALPPTALPELEVALSGSSEQDQALVKIIQRLCNLGTLDYFSDISTARTFNSQAGSYDTSDVALGNYNAFFCEVPMSSLALPAGVNSVGNLNARDLNGDGNVNVLIFKRSAGGSGEGLNNMCGDIAVTAQLEVYYNPLGWVHNYSASSNCYDDGVNFSGRGDPVADDRHWKCSSTFQRKSDGILMDMEHNKSPQPYRFACDGKTLGPTFDYGHKGIWGTIFNTPVSLNFRNALQCVQGLTVGSETEANMPNLPKSVIASVFNGGIANWNLLQAKKADGTYAPLNIAVADRVANGFCPGYNVAVNPIPTDTRVRACRAVQSSGANDQFRVKFLNASCTAQAQDIGPDNTPNSSNANNTYSNWQTVTPSIPTASAMIETSSSTNMASCISAFSDPAMPATQRWAIGIMSLQNNVNLAANYRFIKIDNAAPTLTNVIQNKYFDWVESEWIWLDQNALNGTQNQRDAIDLQQILKKRTGKAAAVEGLVTQAFIHSFGASGMVALNTIPGNTPSLPVNQVNPVATSTHAIGGVLSSCRTPQVRVPTSF